MSEGDSFEKRLPLQQCLPYMGGDLTKKQNPARRRSGIDVIPFSFSSSTRCEQAMNTLASYRICFHVITFILYER
jgi:hypothetical protein